MRFNHHGPAMVMGVIGLVPLTATVDEERVELKDVPAAVRQAADKTVPQASWTEAAKEIDEEVTTYHLNGADAKGREVNITLNADGQVELFETVLSVTDLPDKVVEVLRTLPHVKWTDATEKVEDGKTRYEVSGSDRKDRESTALFDPDGKATIHSDIELSEVPAVVSSALKVKQPAFRAERVRSVTEDRKLVAYLFVRSEGTDGDEMEVTVSADGKTVTIGDDEDEDEDEDD
ncbi:MAG: hypothetical protein ACLQVF_40720 [Isosphaeraceae bacterium]